MQSSAHTRVAYSLAQGLYYKEFLPRSPAESLKALVRGSRATRARRNGDALLRAGIEAPANIAWGSLGAGREYLFTQALPGESVTQWLRVTLKDRQGAALQLRWRLLDELGMFIGRVHSIGFIHGDLRPGNMLVSLKKGCFYFALIDNERTLRGSPPSGRQLLGNLMQLNMLLPSDLTLTDRTRFFRSWRRQMHELSRLEAAILGTEAYGWAVRRLQQKNLL